MAFLFTVNHENDIIFGKKTKTTHYNTMQYLDSSHKINSQEVQYTTKFSDQLFEDLEHSGVSREIIKECFSKLEKYTPLYAKSMKNKSINFLKIKNIGELRFVARLKNNHVYYYLNLNTELGSGTSKVVKSYYDCQKDRLFAFGFVKSPKEAWRKDVFLKENSKEYRLAKKFIPILGNSTVRTHFFLTGMNHLLVATEKCEGTLIDLFSQELTKEDKDSIMKQLLEILKTLHAAGYVHRDIKSENIFYVLDDEQIIIKIADFGFACKKEWKPKYGFKGSPLYVAPEICQVNGNNALLEQIDYAKADVWGAGLVAYHLYKDMMAPHLTTQFPTHLTIRETFSLHMRNVANLKQVEGLDLTQPIDRILAGMLAANPSERLTAEKALEQFMQLKELEASQSAAEQHP